MGEALISRAGGGTTEPEVEIPITPGYHSILVTLKAKSSNNPITNATISCKDGDKYYNYTTNEKGQCLFMCNSGSANLLANNTIEGIRYYDIRNTWMNVDAPVGQSSKINMYHNDLLGVQQFNSSASIIFLNPRVVDINIVGGGGGGSGTHLWSNNHVAGYLVGGAGGYINNYPNQKFESHKWYNFKAGSGGSGGRCTYQVDGQSRSISSERGGTGGTSYIENTNYSATGGGGSGGSSSSWSVGGSGNGSPAGSNGIDSPVSFAGGGGSGSGGDLGYDGSWTRIYRAGSPGGGSGSVSQQHWEGGYVWTYSTPGSGKIGGGGGAARAGTNKWEGHTPFYAGGSGGAGVLRINIKE